MIQRVFTVYDSKAEAYLPPFYQPTVGQALRLFGDMCTDETHQFYRHPEDFTLFALGEYNDEKASFNLTATPVSLGLAVEFKKANNQ